MRTSISLRALLLLVCLPAATAFAADQAGVSAAVRGEVTLARAQAVGRAVVSGEGVFLQDKIRSGDRSGMQILLLDETTFTIGPESEIEVDEFVYDPTTGTGKLSARVAKGVFRFVSGKIAKEQPSNMNVALSSGNIGIRGTMVAGMVNSVTRASLVVLLGEGPDSVSGDPAGSIDVCNAGACTHVERPGFGVRIEGVEARPSPAFRVADDAVHSILQAVTGTGGEFDRATADMRDQDVDPNLVLREDLREAQRDAREQRRRLERFDLADFATILAAQDGVYEQNGLMLHHGQPMSANGIGATTSTAP